MIHTGWNQKKKESKRNISTHVHKTEITDTSPLLTNNDQMPSDLWQKNGRILTKIKKNQNKAISFDLKYNFFS